MGNELDSLMVLRDLEPADIPFIYSTWMRAYYYGNDFSAVGTKEFFFDNHRKLLDRVMNEPKTKVRISCLCDDPDVILGYSVVENEQALHFVFVKVVWRKMGLAKKLIPNTVLRVTHLTEQGKRLKPKNWKYEPLLLLEKRQDGDR